MFHPCASWKKTENTLRWTTEDSKHFVEREWRYLGGSLPPKKLPMRLSNLPPRTGAFRSKCEEKPNDSYGKARKTHRLDRNGRAYSIPSRFCCFYPSLAKELERKTSRVGKPRSALIPGSPGGMGGRHVWILSGQRR